MLGRAEIRGSPRRLIWNLYGGRRPITLEFICGNRELTRATSDPVMVPRGSDRCERIADPRLTRVRQTGVQPMLDAIYLVLGFGFLAVAVLYVVACDRL